MDVIGIVVLVLILAMVVIGTITYFVSKRKSEITDEVEHIETGNEREPHIPRSDIYYKLQKCPKDENTYWTTTEVTNSGQRVWSGGGNYYVYLGVDEKFDTPPSNTIGMVTVTDKFGCPS